MFMSDRYTILWDPRFTGEYVFYDRIFYTDSSVPLKRLSELNKSDDLFSSRFIVVKVNFQKIS